MEYEFNIQKIIKSANEALIIKDYETVHTCFAEATEHGVFSPTLLLKSLQATVSEKSLKVAFKRLYSFESNLREDQKQNISELLVLFCADKYLHTQKFQKSINLLCDIDKWMKPERYKKSFQIMLKAYLSLGAKQEAINIISNLLADEKKLLDEATVLESLINTVESIKPRNRTRLPAKKVPVIRQNDVIYSSVDSLLELLPELELISGSTDSFVPIETITYHQESIKPGTLFIPAIKSIALHDKPNRTAYQQKKSVDEALFLGAAAAVVDEYDSTDYQGYAPVFYYPSRTDLYKKLANHQRQKLSGDMIAITGSFGKTTAREMITQMLGCFQPTSTQFDNRNAISGICETLASNPGYIENCVLELGISVPNSMSELSDIAKPDMIIILDVVDSHLGNYEKQEKLLIEKLKIFNGCSNKYPAIISSNTVDLDKTLGLNLLADISFISVGISKSDDIQLITYSSTEFGGKANIRVFEKFVEVNIPAFGMHLGILACYVLGVAYLKGIALKDAVHSMLSYQPLPLQRGTRYRLIDKFANVIELIDDAQNASRKTVINFINQLSNRKPNRIIFVLGDMLDLGEHSEKEHLALVDEILKSNISILLTVGDMTKVIHKKVKESIECYHFSSVNKAYRPLSRLLNHGDLLALKGSGKMKLSKLRIDFLDKYEQQVIYSGWKIENRMLKTKLNEV